MGAPPQIRSALVLALNEYWERVRADRFAPAWSDIQPGEIKPLLPYIMVVEILSRPFDVRYRIVGSAVVEAFGYDFTWETLRHPVPESDTPAWLEIYGQFARQKGPTFAQYRVSIGQQGDLVVDVGVFPLSSDGVTIDRFIELEDWGAQGAFRPKVVKPTAESLHMLPRSG
jgi:hypothetical protein